MKLEIQRSEERGRGEHGWLHTRFSFSFADYYNPERLNFGALRVLNDDIIDAGAGFPTHGHDNMEIVTIVLEGAIEHKDSTGGHGIIPAGDVQRMSAGSGVQHSEFNASKTEPVKILQTWVFPKEQNIEPSYDQKTFKKEDRVNRLQLVVSGYKEKDTLYTHQNSRYYLGNLNADTKVKHSLKSTEHGVYVFVISGKIKVENKELNERDAMGISETDDFEIEAITNSEVLLIEVPMV